MQFRLKGNADLHVLCDPRAIPYRAPGAPHLDLAAETARGSLVSFTVYDPIEHDHDTVLVDVFVDEPIDPEVERHAGEKQHGLLRVPSGRLVLTDADLLGHQISTAGAQAIPPGNYDVTWFAVDWGEETEHAGDAAAKAASPHGLEAERTLGPLTGVLVVLTIIALGYAGCHSMTSDMPRLEAWRVGRWFALFFAAAWVVVLILWRVTGAAKAARAREARYGEFADFVVHLRRTDDRAGE